MIGTSYRIDVCVVERRDGETACGLLVFQVDGRHHIVLWTLEPLKPGELLVELHGASPSIIRAIQRDLVRCIAETMAQRR